MIRAFGIAGEYLHQHSIGEKSSSPELSALNNKFFDLFEDTILREHINNPWFTPDFVRNAIGAISSMLELTNLNTWLQEYDCLPVDPSRQKTVGVVMAGNIPLVGFHDFLSVLISGHKFFGKPSSKDDNLIRIFADLLIEIEPGFAERIEFTEDYLKNADAQIATGSDNSSRYFKYYFKDIPHIIRKNRNGVAILDGHESRETLLKLGEDIFTYFGMGCRNVTKLYIPENYDLTILLEALEDFAALSNHHKYANNIDYQRTIHLMGREPFLDNGVVLVKESKNISSPVGFVFYEKYSELDFVREELKLLEDQIQCVVTSVSGFENSVLPGETQHPELWDYSDGVDTLQFLTDIANVE